MNSYNDYPDHERHAIVIQVPRSSGLVNNEPFPTFSQEFCDYSHDIRQFPAPEVRIECKILWRDDLPMYFVRIRSSALSHTTLHLDCISRHSPRSMLNLFTNMASVLKFLNLVACTKADGRTTTRSSPEHSPSSRVVSIIIMRHTSQLPQTQWAPQ
jgi:hypothetical protein